MLPRSHIAEVRGTPQSFLAFLVDSLRLTHDHSDFYLVARTNRYSVQGLRLILVCIQDPKQPSPGVLHRDSVLLPGHEFPEPGSSHDAALVHTYFSPGSNAYHSRRCLMVWPKLTATASFLTLFLHKTCAMQICFLVGVSEPVNLYERLIICQYKHLGDCTVIGWLLILHRMFTPYSPLYAIQGICR